MRFRNSIFISASFSTILLLTCFAHQQSRNHLTLYISPQGNDRWSGTLPEPNVSRTDGPFATPERARDEIRALKKKKSYPLGGVVVSIRGGVYELAQSLRLTSEDSGTQEAPINWTNYQEEKVSFTGSKMITDFVPVSEPSVLDRLPQRARGKVLRANLKSRGITDYGSISQRGSPGIELFFGNKRMTLARWPNEGWLRIADVPQSGEKLLNRGLEREKRYDNVPVGRHYGRVRFAEDRPTRWRASENIFLHGYWTWDWSDSYQLAQHIDTANREILFAEPHHHYGYTKNQRYYFLNVLEELDSPGEWYLDHASGDLYFWPPAPITESAARVSLLDSMLVILDDASYVTIQGIHLEISRGGGIIARGGRHSFIAGCTLRLLGGDAVVIDGGVGNGITSCDLYDLGLGAIRMNGGNRQTLAAGKNFAVNNDIHHYGQWVRTGYYGIVIDGVGNRAAHNSIHDAPFEGMYLRGNEHIIEYNEIFRVNLETGDAGAIHTGRDWTWRGNVIRYNYFHHLLGPGLHGVMAAYLDDWASGFTIYGNLFYRAGRAAFIGGGRENVVENNIFVECAPSVHIDARGLGWAGYYFDGTFTWLFDRMEEMKFRRPPYSTQYPELLTLYQDEPRVPKNNKIVRNVSYGGRWMDLYDYWSYDFSVVTVKDNLIADPDIVRRRKKEETGWDPYYLDIDRKEGYVLYKFGEEEIMDELKGNRFVEGNPGFVDYQNGDFQLRDDSPAYKLGFKRIPIEKMGLFVDDFRKVLPAKIRSK